MSVECAATAEATAERWFVEIVESMERRREGGWRVVEEEDLNSAGQARQVLGSRHEKVGEAASGIRRFPCLKSCCDTNRSFSWLPCLSGTRLPSPACPLHQPSPPAPARPAPPYVTPSPNPLWPSAAGGLLTRRARASLRASPTSSPHLPSNILRILVLPGL
jgi:hypothetical protein